MPKDNPEEISENVKVKFSIEKPTPCTVVFTQGGEHVHNWETAVEKLSICSLIASANSSGLVDKSQALNYIVYDDNEAQIDNVLLEGKISPALLK